MQNTESSSDNVQIRSDTQSSSYTSETILTMTTSTVTQSTAVLQKVEVYDVSRHVSTDSGESSSDESTAKPFERRPASLLRTKQQEKPNTSNLLEVGLTDRVLKAGNASPIVKYRETPRGRKSSPRRHSAPITYNEVPPPLPPMPPPPSPPLPSPPPALWPQTYAMIPLPILEPPKTYLNDVDVYDSMKAKPERLDFLDMINNDMPTRQVRNTKEDPNLTRLKEITMLDRSQEDIAYQKTTDLVAPPQRSKLPGQWMGSLWQQEKGNLLEKPAAKLKTPELYGGRGFALSGIASMEDVSRIKQSPVPTSIEPDSHVYQEQEDILRENAKNTLSAVSSNFYSSNSTLSPALGASREYLTPSKNIVERSEVANRSSPMIDHSKLVKDNHMTYGLFRKPAPVVEPVKEIKTLGTKAEPSVSQSMLSRNNTGKTAYTIRPVYDQTELDISKPIRNLDASLPVKEEKETYCEFKVDYVKKQPDEKLQDIAEPKSPVQSRPSSRGASKSQWQLFHERQEAVGIKSPDAMPEIKDDLTMAEMSEAGKVLSLPPAKPAKPVFDDKDSRLFVIQGVKQPEQKVEKVIVDQLNSFNEVPSSSVFAVNESIAANSIKSVALGDVVKPELLKSTSVSKTRVSDVERESAFRITAIRKEFSSSAAQLSYTKTPTQRQKMEQDDQIFENSDQKTAFDSLRTDLNGQSKTPTEAKASLAFPTRQVVEQVKAFSQVSMSQQVQKLKDDGRLFVTTGNRSPLLYADEPINQQDNKKSYYNSVDALDFIPIKQRSAPYMASPLSSDSEVYHSKAASQYDMYVRDSQEKYRAHVNATIDLLPVTVRKDYAIEGAKEFVYPHTSRVPQGTEHVRPPAAQQVDQTFPAVKLSTSVEHRKHPAGIKQPKRSRPYSEDGSLLSASQPDISYGQPPTRHSFVPYKSPRQPEQVPVAKPVIRPPEKPLSSQVHNETRNPPTVPPRYSQPHYQLNDAQIKKVSTSNLLQVDTGSNNDSYSAFAKPMPSPTSAEVEHYSQMKTAPVRSHSPAGTRIVPYIKPHSLDGAPLPSKSLPSKHDSLERQTSELVTSLSSAESSPYIDRNSEKNQSITSLASGLAKIRSIFDGIVAPEQQVKAVSVPNLAASADSPDKTYAELGTQPTQVHHHQRRPTTPRTVKQQQKEGKARSRLATDSQPTHDPYSLSMEPPNVNRPVLHLPYDRPVAGSRSTTPLLERSSSVSAIEQGRRSGNTSPSNSSYVLRRSTTPGRDNPKSLTMIENIKPRMTVPVPRFKLSREQQASALNWANTLAQFNAKQEQQQLQQSKLLTEGRSPAPSARKKPHVVRSSSLKETVPAANKGSSTEEKEKFDQLTIRVTCRTPVPFGSALIPAKQQKPELDKHHEAPAVRHVIPDVHYQVPPSVPAIPAAQQVMPAASSTQRELPVKQVTDAYSNLGKPDNYYQWEEKYPLIPYEIPRVNFDAPVNALPLGKTVSEGQQATVSKCQPTDKRKELHDTVPLMQSTEKRDEVQHEINEPIQKPATSAPVQTHVGFRKVDNQPTKGDGKQANESKATIGSENEVGKKEDKQLPISDSSDKENNAETTSVSNQMNTKKLIESKSLNKLEQRRLAAKAETLVIPTAAQIREKMQAERHKFFTQPVSSATASSNLIDRVEKTSSPLPRLNTAAASTKAAIRPFAERQLLSPVSIGDASDNESTDMDALVKQNEPLVLYGEKNIKVTGDSLSSEPMESIANKAEQAEERSDESKGATGVERRASFKDLLSSFEAKTTPYMRGAKRLQHSDGQLSSEEEITSKVT